MDASAIITATTVKRAIWQGDTDLSRFAISSRQEAAYTAHLTIAGYKLLQELGIAVSKPNGSPVKNNPEGVQPLSAEDTKQLVQAMLKYAQNPVTNRAAFNADKEAFFEQFRRLGIQLDVDHIPTQYEQKYTEEHERAHVSIKPRRNTQHVYNNTLAERTRIGVAISTKVSQLGELVLSASDGGEGELRDIVAAAKSDILADSRSYVVLTKLLLPEGCPIEHVLEATRVESPRELSLAQIEALKKYSIVNQVGTVLRLHPTLEIALKIQDKQ